MKISKIRFVSEGAMIAALYVILTYISMAMGLDKGAVQCRLSEALCVLPVFFPSAVPGLFVGCIISNILTGCAVWDIIFGSLATLIAAIITSKLRRFIYLSPLPAIVMNTLIIPPVISIVYQSEMALPLIFLTVFLGEAVSCGGFGTLLLIAIKKHLNKRIK